MRALTSRRLVEVVVWVLVALTAAPPALLAQTVGGGSAGAGAPPVPIPYGALAQQAPSLLPGQPIVTNPEALQPITRSPAPCPAQGGGAASAPPTIVQESSVVGSERQASLGLAPAAGATRAGVGGAVSGQSMTGSAMSSAMQGGAAAAAPGAGPSSAVGTAAQSSGATAFGGVSIPRHSGLLSPVLQGQMEESHGNVGAAQLDQLNPGSQLTIEDSFSRFFLLQGMTGQLRQFGYNFFDQSFSGFPLVGDMPVGPDYVLGPEDTMAIHIWNVPESSMNRSYISTIERDGTIYVPSLGSVPIAGSTFSQAYQLLHGKLSGLLKRFDLHISMGRLRTIRVFVVGEVVRPGAYDLSSLATASHALYAACGPARSGSLRHVKVMRAGKQVGELDYYEFFLRGDRSQDVQLRAGDTVVVSPIGPVAAIGGPVRRPAIYEIKDQTSLTDLVDLAGGLAPSADRRRCQIFRVEAGQKRVILDVGLESFFNGSAKPVSTAGAPPIQDGDFVRIGSVPLQIENAVTLAGAIRTPGVYELKQGMRLRDLVTTEQLLMDSHLGTAELIRTDPETYETTVRTFNIKGLLMGQEENVELRRLDRVVVASQLHGPRLVSLMGELKRPGNYTLETGERLSSVLKRAGGLTARAFPEGLVLIRESVRQKQQEEIDKFVALQKQRLVVETAALTAGASGTQLGGTGQPANADAVALGYQMQALDQLVNRVHVGRVVLNIKSIETLENTADDVVLEDSDRITIPAKPKTITVIGAIRNSSNILYREDFRVDDYVHAAGGLTDYANEDGMYIVRANGSTEGGYTKVKMVSPGDTIVVPEKIEPKTKPLPLWTAIATIFANVGILAASIAVIGR